MMTRSWLMASNIPQSCWLIRVTFSDANAWGRNAGCTFASAARNSCSTSSSAGRNSSHAQVRMTVTLRLLQVAWFSDCGTNSCNLRRTFLRYRIFQFHWLFFFRVFQDGRVDRHERGGLLPRPRRLHEGLQVAVRQEKRYRNDAGPSLFLLPSLSFPILLYLVWQNWTLHVMTNIS